LGRRRGAPGQEVVRRFLHRNVDLPEPAGPLIPVPGELE
jgi:hypothetical protein